MYVFILFKDKLLCNLFCYRQYPRQHIKYFYNYTMTYSNQGQRYIVVNTETMGLCSHKGHKSWRYGGGLLKEHFSYAREGGLYLPSYKGHTHIKVIPIQLELTWVNPHQVSVKCNRKQNFIDHRQDVYSLLPREKQYDKGE